MYIYRETHYHLREKEDSSLIFAVADGSCRASVVMRDKGNLKIQGSGFLIIFFMNIFREKSDNFDVLRACVY